MSIESRSEQANAVCMICGLCCDGTLFGSVGVTGSERARLERVGLRVVDRDGALLMPLRCSALGGSHCTVYADRPDMCARYECSLRKDVVRGATTEIEARASVLRMKDLLAALGVAPGARTMWEAVVALEERDGVARGSAEERDYDSDVALVSELLELGRAVFEPSFTG